jgi:hypothetical protein
MAEKEPPISDALAIEKEQQKTKRYVMFLLVFALLALVGIFIVFRDSESGGKRTFDLNLSEGKLSLSIDKPIVEQAKLKESTYKSPEGDIKFTTGKVSRKNLQELPNFESISSTSFSGKNFINKEAGFLLAVMNPANWQISYSREGLTNPLTPVNTIYTTDGTHLNVNLESVGDMDVEEYVDASLTTLIASGLLYQMPQVSYDDASGSAFLYYVNPLTDGRTYQKFVLSGGVAYIATANYNESLSDPDIVKELIGMVSTFSLIGL